MAVEQSAHVCFGALVCIPELLRFALGSCYGLVQLVPSESPFVISTVT